MAQIDQFLKVLVEQGGSDLHLTTGSPPVIRVHGHMTRLKFRDLTNKDMETLVYEIMEEEWRMRFLEKLDYDFAYEITGLARFRVNIFWQRLGLGCVMRTIPSKILTADQLGLPESVKRFTMLTKGLVLVTGPTGSGKSTTLAAMVDLINDTRSDHILTIEDPIEFLHDHKNCIVNQREIGSDTMTFANALKYALRQDPDFVLVGEIRDRETMEIALRIAETGHLTLATLHTNSAVQTIHRILDFFPSDQQEMIRTQISFVLQCIITQKLLRRVDGGRVLCPEVLLPNHAIRALIRDDKTHQIYSAMQVGQTQSGMCTMNQSLFSLVENNIIAREEAWQASPDQNELAKMLSAKDGDQKAKKKG